MLPGDPKSRIEDSRHGFTLVELLVVITIIGILIALLLPAVQAAREAARRLSCANNLKQVALAMANYESALRCYPPGRMGCDGMTGDVCSGNPGYQRPGTSGFVMLLPYLEQQTLYDQFAPFAKGALSPSAGPSDKCDGTTTGWRTAEVDAAMRHRPAVLVCPSSTMEPMRGSCATGSYALCQGTRGPSHGIGWAVKHYNDGMFQYRTALGPADVRDGLSNTMFLGEIVAGHTTESMNCWTVGARHAHSLRSTENPLNTMPGEGIILLDGSGNPMYGYRLNGAFASRHPSGGHFAFGDGAVHFLSDNIDLGTYQALSTRSAGDRIANFQP